MYVQFVNNGQTTYYANGQWHHYKGYIPDNTEIVHIPVFDNDSFCFCPIKLDRYRKSGFYVNCAWNGLICEMIRVKNVKYYRIDEKEIFRQLLINGDRLKQAIYYVVNPDEFLAKYDLDKRKDVFCTFYASSQ